MKFEIYTVSSVDIQADKPAETCTCTIGSFTKREYAIRECADYIIERCYLRSDLRYAIMHDENNDQVLSIVSAKSGCDAKLLEKAFAYVMPDDGWEMPPEVEEAIREYLSHMIELYGVYDISTGRDSNIGSTEWIFEISFNLLETEDLMMKEKYMVNPKE